MCSLKKCSKCDQELPLEAFEKHPTCKLGVYPSCKSCNKERKAKETRNKRKRKREALLNSPVKTCFKCGVEKLKEEFPKTSAVKVGNFRLKCSDCKSKDSKISSAKYRDRCKPAQALYDKRPEVMERRKIYRKTRYKAYIAYRVSLRRAQRKQATPPWLTKEHKAQIRDFYRIAKHMSEFHEEKYEVDHIEPLAGKTCCGLMVPWNLRVIPALENRKKGNKLIPLTE